jgi:hypothetical protein
MQSMFQNQPQQQEPTFHITFTFDLDGYSGKVDSRCRVSIVDLRTNETRSFRRSRKTKILCEPRITWKRLLGKMIINNVLEYDISNLVNLRVEHSTVGFQAANTKVSVILSECMDTVEVVSSVSSPCLSPIRVSTGKVCPLSTYSPTSVQQMTHCPPPFSLMTREQQEQAWLEHNTAWGRPQVSDAAWERPQVSNAAWERPQVSDAAWEQQQRGNPTSWSAVDPSVMHVPSSHQHDHQYYGPMTPIQPPQNLRRSYSYSA